MLIKQYGWILLLFLTNCEIVAQKITDGKSIPQTWDGYYNPVLIDDSTPFKQYIKIEDDAVYIKDVGFEYIVSSDGSECVGSPIVSGGSIFHVRSINLSSDTEFHAIVDNVITAGDTNSYVFSIKKIIDSLDKTNFQIITPTIIGEGETFDSVFEKTESLEFTFANTNLKISSITRPVQDPDYDQRPFLEKMTYPGKMYGFWKLTPIAEKFALGLLGLVGMSKDSRVVVFNECVKKTNSDGTITPLLWKCPSNLDAPASGLPVWGYAYRDGAPLDKPSHHLHYEPKNHKYGTYYFQGNFLVGKRNIYLPLMVVGDNLVTGYVRMNGATVTENDWNFFTDIPIQQLLSGNLTLTRIKKDPTSEGFSLDKIIKNYHQN